MIYVIIFCLSFIFGFFIGSRREKISNNKILRDAQVLTGKDAERFISNDHGLIVIRVEDEMYINGQPLIWDEKTQENKDKLNRRFGDDEPYVNPNRQLLKMFENYIADLAVRESFRDTNEGE